MPVFLQFRLWLTQGSVRERASAGLAAAIVVLLLLLASLPLTDDDADSPLTAGGFQAGASATTGVDGTGTPVGNGVTGIEQAAGDDITDPVSGGGGPAAVPAAGADPAGGGGGGGGGGGTPDDPGTAPAPEGRAAQAGPDCSNLGESAPGVSAEKIVVAASIVNLAGPVGNSAFDIRPDMDEIVDAVVGHINDNGGVACGRELVVRKYDVNPIDANDQQAKCLQMVQDGVFSVIDMAGYARPVGRTCFVQNKLPHQVSTSGTEVDFEKGYPYLYGEPASSEKQVRDGILGLHEIGFFPGSSKIGLLVDSCDPTVEAEIDANLRKVGIAQGQISKYKMNCSLVAPPNEILQGVVQHKSAGATHVFLAASLSNSTRYTSLAAQQDYRPAYGVSDYGTLTSANATWDPSAAGTLGITSTRRAELNTGIRNPRIEECHAIITAAGLKGIDDERKDGTAASICDAIFFWQKAINRSGANPTRLSLIESGLAGIGQHQSGVGSDGLWDRRGKVFGGDLHRPLRLDGDCLCMKILDPTFKPGF